MTSLWTLVPSVHRRLSSCLWMSLHFSSCILALPSLINWYHSRPPPWFVRSADESEICRRTKLRREWARVWPHLKTCTDKLVLKGERGKEMKRERTHRSLKTSHVRTLFYKYIFIAAFSLCFALKSPMFHLQGLEFKSTQVHSTLSAAVSLSVTLL